MTPRAVTLGLKVAVHRCANDPNLPLHYDHNRRKGVEQGQSQGVHQGC